MAEANSRLPTINVIKPEPEDPGEAAVTFQRGQSPPSSFPFVTVTKSSPVYQGQWGVNVKIFICQQMTIFS